MAENQIDVTQLLEDYQEDISALEKEVEELSLEVLEERKKLREAFLGGFLSIPDEPLHAEKAWLQFAAERKWEV